LLIEKLHTTHQKAKLKMFGDALANSISVEFRSDDKEQYVRILRDLSLKDLEVLNHKNLKGWTPFTKSFSFSDEILSCLSRLAGMGLVHEHFVPLSDAALNPQQYRSRNSYSLSGFGIRFLQFLESRDTNGSAA